VKLGQGKGMALAQFIPNRNSLNVKQKFMPIEIPALSGFKEPF
jgi:hypothetical protein